METDPTVALYDFYGWLQTNRKRVLAGAIVVALIAAIAGFVMWNNNQKEASANQALLAAPSLLGTAPPGDPAAAKALLGISQDYSGTSAGIAAQLLAARELFLGGKYAEAQQELSKFVASHPGHPLVPQASVGIAACLEAQGKISDAVQQYKRVTSLYATSANIIIPVKLTLGRLSEADNKPDQAVIYYKDLASLIQNDPNDPWVAEAYERLRLLVAKHPELNPNPPQASAPASSPLLTPSEAEMQLMAPPSSAAPAPPPAAPPATNQNPQAIPMTNIGTSTNLAPTAATNQNPQVTSQPLPGGRDGGQPVAPATNQSPPTMPPATNAAPAGNP